MEDNVQTNQSADIRVEADEKDGKILSTGLIVSIILSVLSVAIFTWLIFSLFDPVRILVLYSVNQIMDENFFMRIIFADQTGPNQWVNGSFQYKIGFYILFPIALVSFLISGLTVLVKGYKSARILILINWVLYLVPIISSFIVTNNYLLNQSEILPEIDLEMHPAGIFRWFILINVFIQISMLLFEEDFHQWILSSKGPNGTRKANNLRVVTFFLFYSIAWLSPIVIMINYEFSYEFLIFLIIGLALLVIWWAIGDSIRLAILMNKEGNEFNKNIMLLVGIISLVLGLSTIVANIVISTAITDFYLPLLLLVSCIILTIGTASSSLMSKSLLGKIAYAVNALCLVAIAIVFLVIVGIRGYSGLF